MPIHYNISPELNLILYLCEDLITETEFFKVVEQATNDPRWHSGMYTIIDTLNAEVDFQPAELQHTLQWLNQKTPQPVAILTQNKAATLLIETVNLLLVTPHIKLATVEHLEQALPHLGLVHAAQAVQDFWQASKSFYSN